MTEININWNFFLSVGIGTMANLIFAMSCGALAVVVGHLVGIERGFLKGLVTFIIYMVVSNIGSLLLYKIVTKTFVSLDNGNIFRTKYICFKCTWDEFLSYKLICHHSVCNSNRKYNFKCMYIYYNAVANGKESKPLGI